MLKKPAVTVATAPASQTASQHCHHHQDQLNKLTATSSHIVGVGFVAVLCLCINAVAKDKSNWWKLPDIEQLTVRGIDIAAYFDEESFLHHLCMQSQQEGESVFVVMAKDIRIRDAIFKSITSKID